MVAAANQQKVLVSGATGFIGAHVTGQLLQKGYHVRAAVRNQQKADALAASFAEYKDRLEFVFIDLSKPNSFDNVLAGLTGVFHVAAPLPWALKNNVKVDFLDPNIEGNLGLLRAVSKTPSIKRVVITSSAGTIMDYFGGDLKHVYNEKDWMPITYEQAEKAEGPMAPLVGYLAGKALAEKAAWDFMEKEKPHFDIVTILPTFVFGPADASAKNISDVSTLRIPLEQIFVKKEIDTESGWNNAVDVRDVASAHILAFENPKTTNQRYIVSNGPFSWREFVQAVHKDFPGKTQAPPVPSPLPDLPPSFPVDASKSKELGLVYRPRAETFRDTIAYLIKAREQGKLMS